MNNKFSVFKKQGFTFSEIVLTVVIIGVVFAITISSVYGNYNKLLTSVKIKNFYKVMNDAITEAIEENQGKSIFYYDEKRILKSEVREDFLHMMQHLRPHLMIAKECGFEHGECSYNSPYTYYNGYKPEPDDELSQIIQPDTYTIMMPDGSYVYIDTLVRKIDNEHIYYSVFYDLNGDKGPNKVGYDLFSFELFLIQNVLYPEGAYKPKDYIIEDDCHKGGTGLQCASKILANKDYN